MLLYIWSNVYKFSFAFLKVNSPIQLESSEEEQSYLSLQAPPGRSIEDTIQFETLDLYIWTGPGFRSPALLFYAGPTYFEGEDDISKAEMGTEVRQIKSQLF